MKAWSTEELGKFPKVTQLGSGYTGCKCRQSDSRAELLISRALVAPWTGHTHACTHPQIHALKSGEEAGRLRRVCSLHSISLGPHFIFFRIVFHLLIFRSNCLFKWKILKLIENIWHYFQNNKTKLAILNV